MTRNSLALFVVAMAIFTGILGYGLHSFSVAIQKPTTLALALQGAEEGSVQGASTDGSADPLYVEKCGFVGDRFSDPRTVIPEGFVARATYFYNSKNGECLILVDAEKDDLAGNPTFRSDLFRASDSSSIAWYRAHREDAYTPIRVDSCIALGTLQRLCQTREEFEAFVKVLTGRN